jgi:anti-sigma B factor antagonist
MSVKLNIRETDGVSIIDVSGRLTLGESANTLRNAVRELAESGQRKIVLNLTELSFIDSSGLGLLVGGFAAFTRLGGQLKLVNLSNRVKELLVITKLYTVFEVFDNEATAIGSFVEQPVQTQTTPS